MKKTLIILLVLAFAVPAWADVCIYNWKGKEVVYNYVGPDLDVWDMQKQSHKGYFIIDITETGDDVWGTATYIETWTEKDSDGTHKLMTSWEEDFHIVTAGAGNKTTMIFSSLTGYDYLILFTGPIKNGVAKKLTGTQIQEFWGTSPIPDELINGTYSLSLNTKWTAAAKNEGLTTVEEVVNFVAGELIKKGYKEP